MRFKPYYTWIFVAIILFLCMLSLKAAQVPDNFLAALHQVESSGRTGLVWGKNGDLGPLQITRAYWKDSGVKGSFMQCTNLTYAKSVVRAYLSKYAAPAVLSRNFEYMSRVHHGGPQGAKKAFTRVYWRKVSAEMARQ